jgi:hypothetical protein
MKKNYTKSLVLAIGVLLLNIPSLFAQEFSITGEIRPRTEFRNGFKTLAPESFDPAVFVEQRSRLYFNYKAEKVKFRLAFQDVRIWGSTNQIYKADSSISNVYEAWGEYAFSNKFSVRAGRQAWDYDNARFLGDLDWAQQGRSHEGLLFVFKDSTGFQLHAGFAFNQKAVNEPGKLKGNLNIGNETANYKDMQFLWLHKDFTDKAGLSFYFVNNGYQKAKDTVNYRQTLGLMGSVKPSDKLKLEAELFYQMGKNAAYKNVSAMLASFSATLNTKLTPITLGGDYLSGTKATDTDDKAFNPLFGTNHKFYGYMDYFYVGNGHKNVGLIDLFLKTNFKLGKKATLAAHYHHFESPVEITGSATTELGKKLSSGLGEEVDLVFTAKPAPDVVLNIGYSQMFATDTMNEIKGIAKPASYNSWAWVMLAIKPTLFKTK